MSNDRLRFDLADLADEVTPVNLHDRVLRESRKIGIQRAVITSAAAVAVVAAVSAGAFAAIPHGTAHRTPGGTTTTAPPSTPAPSTSAPSRPPSSSPPSHTATPPGHLVGTTFYVQMGNSGSVTLHSVSNGVDHTTVRFPTSAGACPYYTVSVSPSGSRIAWITDAGELFVANADGSAQKTVVGGLDCLGSEAPRWRSDASFVGPLVNGKVIGVDATTATITDHNVAQPGVSSPNGKFYAGQTQSGQRYVFNADSSAHQNFGYTLPNTGAVYDGWSVRSVSNDGHYVSVGGNPTDTGRNTGSFDMVDVRTSRVVHLPVSGTITHISFLSDGTILVTTRTQYVLLDSSLHKIASKSTTLGWGSGEWLTYIP